MRPRFTARGVMIATSVERAKLAARLEVRGVLAACVCVPLAFGAAMRGEAVVPEDTLFGRAIVRSGAALPLVVLGFAAAWVFPLLASVVAADVFAAEYRHGTWPMLLTRSRTASTSCSTNRSRLGARTSQTCWRTPPAPSTACPNVIATRCASRT